MSYKIYDLIIETVINSNIDKSIKIFDNLLIETKLKANIGLINEINLIKKTLDTYKKKENKIGICRKKSVDKLLEQVNILLKKYLKENYNDKEESNLIVNLKLYNKKLKNTTNNKQVNK